MMMNRASRIIGLRSGNDVTEPEEHVTAQEPQAAPPAPAAVAAPELEEDADEADEASLGRGGWVLPVLGTLVSLAWVGGMLWLTWPSLQATPPMALAGFVAALCTPPALIGVLLLLRLRTSTAEARRFGQTAR